MSTCRRWTQDEFRTVFLEHPVMRLTAQNLIWTAHDADEQTVSFRVGDDLGLLDAHEEPVALPVGAVIKLAHPLETSSEWASHCIDYHMTPLMEQVSRGSCAEVPESLGSHVLGEALLGLGAYGWELHGDGRTGAGGLRRGLKGGYPDLWTSTACWSPGGSPPTDPVRLLKAKIIGERSRMDPVKLSGVIRDLVRLPWLSKSWKPRSGGGRRRHIAASGTHGKRRIMRCCVLPRRLRPGPTGWDPSNTSVWLERWSAGPSSGGSTNHGFKQWGQLLGCSDLIGVPRRPRTRWVFRYFIPACSPVLQPFRPRALRTNQFLGLKSVDPGNGLFALNS